MLRGRASSSNHAVQPAPPEGAGAGGGRDETLAPAPRPASAGVMLASIVPPRAPCVGATLGSTEAARSRDGATAEVTGKTGGEDVAPRAATLRGVGARRPVRAASTRARAWRGPRR